MMPILVAEPPNGRGWIHEVKFDCYRTQMIIDTKDVSFFTRRGFDWTAKYKALAGTAIALKVEDAVVDGEVVVLDETGLSDFTKLRSAITSRPGELYSWPSTSST
jgi:bifunctional non-homologous end joining protein LigD